MLFCEFCGKGYNTSQGLSNHKRFCVDNPEKVLLHTSESERNCDFCGKLCHNENSWMQHRIRCPQNPNRIEQSRGFSGKTGWNRGETYLTNNSVAQGRKKLKEYYTTHSGTFLGRKHSESAKEKISIAQTEHDHSLQDRFSFGKKGYFDNILFMSTWELAYYIYMRDTGHHIVPCDKRFPYTYKGKKHYYTPDFIVDGEVVEIKGHETNLDLVKYQCVPNLKVLYHNDILYCIDYVKIEYQVSDLCDLYNS